LSVARPLAQGRPRGPAIPFSPGAFAPAAATGGNAALGRHRSSRGSGVPRPGRSASLVRRIASCPVPVPAADHPAAASKSKSWKVAFCPAPSSETFSPPPG